jgi:hypothetical protein
MDGRPGTRPGRTPGAARAEDPWLRSPSDALKEGHLGKRVVVIEAVEPVQQLNDLALVVLFRQDRRSRLLEREIDQPTGRSATDTEVDATRKHCG